MATQGARECKVFGSHPVSTFLSLVRDLVRGAARFFATQDAHDFLGRADADLAVRRFRIPGIVRCNEDTFVMQQGVIERRRFEDAPSTILSPAGMESKAVHVIAG